MRDLGIEQSVTGINILLQKPEIRVINSLIRRIKPARARTLAARRLRGWIMQHTVAADRGNFL
jgi:hypothetical protein